MRCGSSVPPGALIPASQPGRNRVATGGVVRSEGGKAAHGARTRPASAREGLPAARCGLLPRPRGRRLRSLEQGLLKLEKRFRVQGADYYRAHVDGDCLLAFTEMPGIHSNEEIAAMNPGAGAWRAAELDPKGCISLGDDAAVITYEV